MGPCIMEKPEIETTTSSPSIDTPHNPFETPEGGVCYFFKLSGEIRNRIYEYTFTSGQPL